MIIEKLPEGLFENVVAMRRDFHMYPEIAGEETRTPDVIAKILAQHGIEVTRNIGNNGVVGLIKGAHAGKTVALRADFDALPIQETADVPYASKNAGRMHACGHDAHTAIALGTAILLNSLKESLCGNVKFIFQPAEEKAPDGGAKFMIADGVLQGVDAIFGLHVWPSVTLGQIGFKYGGMMASSDPFKIRIRGKSTHASQPENGIDATVVAAQFVTALQSIVSRQVGPLDSAVVTVGKLHSGTAYNIVSGEAFLEGTVRTVDRSVRDKMEQRIKNMLEGICQTCGAEGELEYYYGYPALMNDKEMVDLGKKAAVAVFGEDCVHNVERSALGGEDFAFYLEKVPGAFFWLGCCAADDPEIMPIHNPKFHIDERCLEQGVLLMTNVALEFLTNQQ